MSLHVCSRAFLIAATAVAVPALQSAASAQSPPASFKAAWLNIQAGKGEPGLPGHLIRFPDSTNCTDTSQPLNAWGIGLVQQHLADVADDPAIVVLGLAESWASTCGSPENVRRVLGWTSRTGERNGVAMVARHGFAGPEEWRQLDTTLNTNQADTMWVLRMAVCLDAGCTQSTNVFASHWYASGTNKVASYDRQAAQTAAFLKTAGGTAPHVLIGDLNVWEGSAAACGESPTNIGLERLRAAGYVDAWPLLHGSAEGFTGMMNRKGCGYLGEGYAWKRPDYTWSPAGYLPLSIERFGVVPAGDEAPSDHYGLITEFPWPGAAPAPASSPGEIVLHAKHATVVSGAWQIVGDQQAAGGARLWNPDASVPKLAAAYGTPAHHFELTFTAQAGTPYRLWMRGRADNDAWTNDSVYVQFSGSVTAAGAPVNRIGTTGATWVGIEACAGCGLAGWGWQDNGYGPGVLGPLVYFARTGPQTMRIQRREDGISLDQIVLSPAVYLKVSPGQTKQDTVVLPISGANAPPP